MLPVTIKWIGNRSSREQDIIIVLNEVYYDAVSLSDLITKVVKDELGLNIGEWCPFHWFESRYLLPKLFTPIHLLLYGSKYEMRSVENDSIFKALSAEIQLNCSFSNLSDQIRQILSDLWRLRICLVEQKVCPRILKTAYTQAAIKAIQYVLRSYSLNSTKLISSLSKCSINDGAEVMKELTLYAYTQLTAETKF